jgi:amino acid permease
MFKVEYTVSLHGNWDVSNFFFSYTMVALFHFIYFAWNFLRETKILNLTSGVAEIDEYARNYIPMRSKPCLISIVDR